tara:strand:- start:829 stop:1167 length:339 start_codon:yes stop_codon:yes gene_type:complete
MPTIRINKELQKKMSKKQFEDYLVGSGKPEGVAVTIVDEEITWGEEPVAVVPTPEPVPVLEIADEPVAVDFGKMTKLEIEEYVRDTYAVELDRRHTKGDMIAQAMKLEKGEA